MPTLHDPVAVELLGISIRWYALFLLTGIIASLLISVQLAKRRGLDPDFLIDVAPWVVFAAIAGARLYYVLLKAGHFASNPEDIVNVRLGGLTVHGALAAGVATFWWFCRRREQPFLMWGDVVIAGLPVGQAIGRWGNWANQEAFGTPSSLPWAVSIDPDRRPPEYLTAPSFHPAFLYEAVLDLAIAAVLIWIVLEMPKRSWLRPGDAIWVYLILYGAARLVVESIRTDSLSIGPLPAAYWVSLGLIAIGAAGVWIRHRHGAQSVTATGQG